MPERPRMNIFAKTIMGSVVSLCLFLYNPLITLAQAPPEDIGAPPENLGGPLANLTSPPSPEDLGGPIAQNRVKPAPPLSIGGEPTGAPPGRSERPPFNLTSAFGPVELASAGCQSNISDATIDGNDSNLNASVLNNRSNEFGSNAYDPRFTLTTTLIAKDLGNLSPNEIKDYDLKDLSAEEMKSVLCMLTSGNLTKVLMNIPVEDLLFVRGKLTSQIFLNILQMLPAKNGTQIMNRTTELGR